MKNAGRAHIDVLVDVDYFTVVHADTAADDNRPTDPNARDILPEQEPASALHLTQVHDLVLRIQGQLSLISGEQAHYRKRCGCNL
jgi:hypothetical protein